MKLEGLNYLNAPGGQSPDDLIKLNKNKIADPNSPACAYMGLAILVVLVFLVFSRIFWFLTKKYQKPRENQKKQKNKIADPNSPACTCMGLAILVLFAFLHDVRPCASW